MCQAVLTVTLCQQPSLPLTSLSLRMVGAALWTVGAPPLSAWVPLTEVLECLPVCPQGPCRKPWVSCSVRGTCGGPWRAHAPQLLYTFSLPCHSDLPDHEGNVIHSRQPWHTGCEVEKQDVSICPGQPRPQKSAEWAVFLLPGKRERLSHRTHGRKRLLFCAQVQAGPGPAGQQRFVAPGHPTRLFLSQQGRILLQDPWPDPRCLFPNEMF